MKLKFKRLEMTDSISNGKKIEWGKLKTNAQTYSFTVLSHLLVKINSSLPPCTVTGNGSPNESVSSQNLFIR